MPGWQRTAASMVAARPMPFSIINRQINGELFTRSGRSRVLAPAELLRRVGLRRDMAALFVEACRRFGVAARFVQRLFARSEYRTRWRSSHAKAEVYLPGAGWKGFDPTAASIVGPDHITVAVHQHPEAIPPVAGSFTGPQGRTPKLVVDVQITQLADDAPQGGPV